jgi:hypothetical protein
MSEAITLTREQARYLGLYVGSIDGAASVDLHRRDDGGVDLMVFDKTGEQIAFEPLGSESDLALP